MTQLDRVYDGPVVAWPRWWRRPAVLAASLAAVLGLVWALWLARDAGDLAAQYAWTAFVRRHPGAAYLKPQSLSPACALSKNYALRVGSRQ